MVLHSRQRTLKPQRFQGSFYTIPASIFPLFFPLQVFKGDFQGVQPPRRRVAQDARAAANPTALSDFQHPDKGTNRQAPADLRSTRQTPKSASACGFEQHPGIGTNPPTCSDLYGTQVSRGTCAALLDKETTVVGKSNNGGPAGDMAPVSESDTRAAAAPAGVPPKFCGYLRRR